MGLLAITLHDLRFRYRQFVIAVAGASLVFAMGLLLSGMAAGFRSEIRATVAATSADSWVLAKDASGRIGALPLLPASSVSAVAREPGVQRAAPLILGGETIHTGSGQKDVVLIGATPGELGSTSVSSGSPIAHDGEAVADTHLSLPVGSRLDIAGVPLSVVGKVRGRTLFAGQPILYVSLRDAQRILYGGRPLISAVITTGTPARLPVGLSGFSNAQIDGATLAEMSSAVSSIGNTRIFMWAIAAFIVAALVYVTALDRTRDFAVLKALGSSTKLLFLGLALQAVLVALSAAAIAAVISNFMTGLFAQPVDIPGSAFVALPAAALAVGLIASLAALRRAVGADPAAAFAGR